MNSGSGPQGLGGWLFILGILIVLSLVVTILYASLYFGAIFVWWSMADWSALSDIYGVEIIDWESPLVPLFLLETVFNLGFILWLFRVVYLFFSKKAVFVKSFIFYQIAFPVVYFLENVALYMLSPDESFWDADTVETMVGSAIVLAIIIPYLLLSSRVEATFVN